MPYETSPFLQSVLWKSVLFPFLRLLLALTFVGIPIALVQIYIKSLETIVYPELLFTCLVVPITYAAYWSYVRLIERRPATELGVAGSVAEFGRGLLMGTGLFVVTIGILWAIGSYHVTGTNNWFMLVESLGMAVLSGFIEELMMRGIMFRIIEESVGTWIALALSAVLFGAMHLGNPHATVTSAAAIALEAGLLLGACYVLTRRLWFAIGLHLAWNFTQGGIFGVAVSGTTAKGILQSTLTGPTFLSGGGFGAEASIVAVVVCVTGFVIVIMRAQEKGRIVKPFWQREPEHTEIQVEH
jgi:membrane protease YdiL (CAAX protease family)